MRDNGIIWEDPPDARLHQGRTEGPVLAACRENPGKWAVYPARPEVASGTSHYLRSRGFESVSRKGKVYVRYSLQEDGA